MLTILSYNDDLTIEALWTYLFQSPKHAHIKEIHIVVSMIMWQNSSHVTPSSEDAPYLGLMRKKYTKQGYINNHIRAQAISPDMWPDCQILKITVLVPISVLWDLSKTSYIALFYSVIPINFPFIKHIIEFLNKQTFILDFSNLFNFWNDENSVNSFY